MPDWPELDQDGDEARVRGDADQSTADNDQTAADLDQTGADADQALAERDQRQADVDQRASNRDQVASDRELTAQPNRPWAVAQAHAKSRDERDIGTIERTTASIARAAIAAERLEQAGRRDRAAHSRDLTAQARDLAAEAHDRATRLGGSRSQARSRAATDRAAAANDRARAAEDREQAAADREAARSSIEHAHLDTLTGAYQRAVGLVAVRHEVERARREARELALAFVDVDGLTQVNDRVGHAAGDALLGAVVHAMRSNVRSYEPIVRFGGDEFLCAMSGLDLDAAHERFTQIRSELASAHAEGTISVGLAMLAPGDTVDDLIARADAALLATRR